MQPKNLSPWGEVAAAVGILVAAAFASGFCIIACAVVAPSLSKIETLAIAYAVQFAVAIGALCLFYRYRGDRPLLRAPMRWYDAVVILGGIVAITAAGVVLEPVLNLFPARYFDSLAQLMAGGGWTIVLAVVLAPACEEIFFRGLVLEHLARKWSAAQAVAVSALFFGLVHLPNLPQALNAAVVGVVLGYIYILTRSLVPVVAIHAVNNAVAWLLVQTYGTQNTDTRALIGSEANYWAVFALCAVIFVATLTGMWHFARRGDTKRREGAFTTKTEHNETHI